MVLVRDKGRENMSRRVLVARRGEHRQEGSTRVDGEKQNEERTGILQTSIPLAKDDGIRLSKGRGSSANHKESNVGAKTQI